LADNNFADPECMRSLADGLLQNKVAPYLIELDLQRCGLTSECIKPLAEVFASKFKLRNLNLSNNGIQDEGARELISAI